MDNLTVLEAVPHNSPSLLNVVVDDIHAFAINNSMRLNSRKCKTVTETTQEVQSALGLYQRRKSTAGVGLCVWTALSRYNVRQTGTFLRSSHISFKLYH